MTISNIFIALLFAAFIFPVLGNLSTVGAQDHHPNEPASETMPGSNEPMYGKNDHHCPTGTTCGGPNDHHQGNPNQGNPNDHHQGHTLKQIKHCKPNNFKTNHNNQTIHIVYK